MKRFCAAWIACLSVGLMVVAGCGGDDSGTDPAAGEGPEGGKFDNPGQQEDPGLNDTPKVCAGIRGNGQLIFAHFASLAPLHEHYGTLDGAAGGSSGSITIFLTESMYANPALVRCGEHDCDRAEAGLRAAFMYKSLWGYVQALAGTEEGIALMSVGPIVEKATNDGIGELFEGGDIEAGRQALVTLFESDDIKSLINPEIFALLTDSPDPAFHAMEIWDTLSGFGSFSADDPKILIRPGILDFGAVADKLGRIANFYAAYTDGEADWGAEWGVVLDACATETAGMSWAEAAAVKAGESTCGALFGDLLTRYRAALLANEDGFPKRVEDPIAGSFPALVSTSVLTGNAAGVFSKSREAWLGGAEAELNGVDFADIKFGYWGSRDLLDTVVANDMRYEDSKTQRFLSLGESNWRTALSYSPAEPGLARALEIDDTNVSAGGWSDLHPTLVLRNMGCDEVIYVTRKDPESNFAMGVAGLLGMTAEDKAALYDLDVEDGVSSFALSIEQASAVWCTNWNAFEGTQLTEVFDDAYNAPLQTESAHFTKNAAYPYANVTDRVGAVGCTYGVSE